jgi:hypothetical protein
MNSSAYLPRLSILLCAGLLLSACKPDKQVVCDDSARARAQQFLTQVLEQEANGMRLRELAEQSGRRVFYANVAYDPAEERKWEVIGIRNDFKIGEATCGSEVMDDAGRVAAQIDVRVEFPDGLWFDRQSYGALPASQHIYTLRLGEKFKITSRLPQPFISGKTALSVLGTEPYTAEALMTLREDMTSGQRR